MKIFPLTIFKTRRTTMHDRRAFFILMVALWLAAAVPNCAWAQTSTSTSSAAVNLDWKELFQAGGAIGWVIVFLSLAMVALVLEHIFTIRRGTLMPRGLAENVHQFLGQGQIAEAQQQCQSQPSFLAYVMSSGLAEVGLGYSVIQKAMEDASVERSARLFRKIEYLSVIGTLAPMLGLLGTVWGMIFAFLEFESKANPQVAELAPGIYKALVTTLMGLGVAVPALASFAFFRNRIDELVADASLTAEHVFGDYRRNLIAKRRAAKRKKRQKQTGDKSSESEQSIPSVAIERNQSD